ncbi:MAG: SEC-C metal-binding domain-containing protein [Aliidongia sp.]
MRAEQEIFDELAALCISPGFVHVIAIICLRDNVISLGEELTADDLAHLFSRSRLIRTEITTLVGLMMRARIDFTLPNSKTISALGVRAEQLLEELHQSMKRYWTAPEIADPNHDLFTLGDSLREPIFYGGESAYIFQYRDLASMKYRADAQWLREKKSVDLQAAREIGKQLIDLLGERLTETVRTTSSKPPDERTMLPGFVFSCATLAARTGLQLEVVQGVVHAFCLPDAERNTGFTNLHAFNGAYAYPFIWKGPDEFVMFQYYGFVEALYDGPFYWMLDDKVYAAAASDHRGDFTEAFAVQCLTNVFGADHVFHSVEILENKSKTLGEIDVLVIFGDRAIVLQAKSKKLTLAARAGNDLMLQKDFKEAVQEAVEQASDCAKWLNDPSLRFRIKKDGKLIKIGAKPSVIFPISLLAEHYPALVFQALHFLKCEETDQIVRPLVIDVFALDTICEMLTSPLRFLSYLGLRAKFGGSLLISHERIALSYHLKRNLWIEVGRNLAHIRDDIAVDLDVAMLVRREGLPGVATPAGILTKFVGTPFARLIADIENTPSPAAIDLGLTLLELSEPTVEEINECIKHILGKTAADAGIHDMSMEFSGEPCGLTIHCSHLPPNLAEQRLRAHCHKRKYFSRATKWFGLALRPDGSLMIVAELGKAKPLSGRMRAAKVGRNAPCPCGSEKKFKKCCGTG